MIVTTSLRPNEQMNALAKEIAFQLDLPFVFRNKEAMNVLHEQFRSDIFVVGSNRLSIHQLGNDLPLFFHPSSAMFRAKRVLKGETDPYLQATKLKANMTVLDCTLGLASDSIISSIVIGEKGKVVGVEGNRYLAFLVKQGLQTWDSGIREMNDAMKRITVFHSDHLQFLRSQKTNSFDVVYFDPMFETKIESDGINAIRKLAVYHSLEEETIEEARRVAKSRVVLKDHWKSSRFDRFQFRVYKRSTAQFHYASIEL